MSLTAVKHYHSLSFQERSLQAAKLGLSSVVQWELFGFNRWGVFVVQQEINMREYRYYIP